MRKRVSGWPLRNSLAAPYRECGARTRLFPTDAQELAGAANDAAEMNGAGYKVYVGVDPAGAPREIVRRPPSMSISP
jgi:hypothetical protein